MLDVPGRVVLEGVVSTAEGCEVVDACLPAERVVARVVEVAVARRLTARWKAAPLIPREEMSLHLRRRAIPIDREQGPGDWMRQDPVPSGGGTGQVFSRRDVDRSASGDLRGSLGRAQQRENRHGH